MWSSTLMILGSGGGAARAAGWCRRSGRSWLLQCGREAGRAAPATPARPAPTRASPARTRSTTSVDAEAGVVLELALVGDGPEGDDAEPARVPSGLLGQRAQARAGPRARPRPPMGIQPSAHVRDGREHRVVGAAADEGAAPAAAARAWARTRSARSRRTRRGTRPARATRWPPWPPGARARRRGGGPKSTPWSSASARFHPKPTPSVTRPPERWSSVATCLASTIGSCWAASRMPVPSPMRVVTAAAVDSATSGSRQRL